MNNKITLKDIAREAEVSIGSVHLALTGKNGVSDKTRQMIKEIAEKLDYKPNMLASNLKREARNIAVVLPKRGFHTQFYYDFMWDALNDAEAVGKDYNLNTYKYEYEYEYDDLTKVLDELDLSKINGLITMGYPIHNVNKSIKRITDAGIPVIFLDSDLPETERICCIKPDCETIGKLTGELLLNMIHRIDGKILVCAGKIEYPNHYLIVNSLSKYLEDHGISNRLLIANFDEVNQEHQNILEDIIKNNKIVGCCSVNSRSTLVLAKAIIGAGKSYDIPVIGNGLFQESAKYLHEGIITAIIHKKPYEQCYQAMSMMSDLLARNTNPPQEIVHISVDAIFKSTLEQYNSVSSQRAL